MVDGAGRVPRSAVPHWLALGKLLWVSLGPGLRGHGGGYAVLVVLSAVSFRCWVVELDLVKPLELANNILKCLPV